MSPPLTSEQQALVVQWMPYAYKMVRDFLRRNPRLKAHSEDSVQAACEGLIYAATKFDPNHGTKFCTYATSWITQYLRRGGSDIFNITGTRNYKNLARFDVRAEVDVYEDHVLAPTQPVTTPPEGELARKRVEKALRKRLLREFRTSKDPVAAAERALAIFMRVKFDEEITYVAIGQEYEISRQRIEQLIRICERHFEAWASEVRTEVQ